MDVSFVFEWLIVFLGGVVCRTDGCESEVGDEKRGPNTGETAVPVQFALDFAKSAKIDFSSRICKQHQVSQARLKLSVLSQMAG